MCVHGAALPEWQVLSSNQARHCIHKSQSPSSNHTSICQFTTPRTVHQSPSQSRVRIEATVRSRVRFQPIRAPSTFTLRTACGSRVRISTDGMAAPSTGAGSIHSTDCLQVPSSNRMAAPSNGYQRWWSRIRSRLWSQGGGKSQKPALVSALGRGGG